MARKSLQVSKLWYHSYMQNHLLEKSVASVQHEFEPIFWVHSDPLVILEYAEKKILSHKLYDQFGYEDSSVRVLSYEITSKKKHKAITREKALTYVGKRHIRIQERTNDVFGSVSDVFTIQETQNQLGLTPEDIGGGIIAIKVTANFKVKEIE